MEKSVKLFLSIGAVGVVVIAIFAYFFIKSSSAPGKYDEFAGCLSEKGMVFYGAFWCPHCQAAKKMFGTSFKKLKSVECSTADGQSQTQECRDAQIASYPTWIFADGSRLEGEKTFAELAEKTGCALPQ